MAVRFGFVAFSTIVTCFLFYVSYWRPQTVSDVQRVLTSHGNLAQQGSPFDLIFAGVNTTEAQRADKVVADVFRDNLDDVRNSTLGFQELKVISLPARADKRDAFSVQAALSDMDFDFVDGIDGNNVPEKALPYKFNQGPGQIGCWRAHMNIFQEMVDRRIQSTVIFEDDADWDVALRSQLVQLARGSRFLLDIPPNARVLSPYGDGWDLIWLGHCGSLPFEEPDNFGVDPRRYVIPDDPTVGIHDNGYVMSPDMSPWDTATNSINDTRIVFRQRQGVCTASYAISLRGAAKALYHMSMLPFNQPVDWGLSDMCEQRKSDFTCITTFPTIVAVSKPPGRIDRGTDIGYGEDGTQVREEGFTEKIMYPSRLNIDQLLSGSDTYKSQYPEYGGVSELSLGEIGRAVGHPEVVIDGQRATMPEY